MRRTHIAGIFLALASVAGSARSQNIDTGAPDSWTAYVGPSWYYKVGQVFTPGTPSALTSFSFYLGEHSENAFVGQEFYGATGVAFTAHLRAFDGALPSGTDLFASAVQVFYGPPATTDYNDFTRFTFATNGLQLSSGQQYIAYLEAIDDGEHLSNAVVGYTTNVTVPAGAGIFLDGIIGDDPSWNIYVPGDMMSFDATFEESATPEPASVILLASGLLGVIGVTRRRKRQ
ncbi:MAG: PEP-CTERM sorting domain-containing protein [Gemmatimonadota bacterium]